MSTASTSTADAAIGDRGGEPLSPVVVAPGEGRTLCAFGDTLQLKLGGPQTGGRLTVALGLVGPGDGPPPHRHHHDDELFIVAEGTMSYLVNGQWQDVGPGGVAFMPRGAPHTFKNRTDRPARQWIVTTPSGFETFFGRCAEAFAAGGAAGPDMARVMQICGEHGIEILSPPQG